MHLKNSSALCRGRRQGHPDALQSTQRAMKRDPLDLEVNRLSHDVLQNLSLHVTSVLTVVSMLLLQCWTEHLTKPLKPLCLEFIKSLQNK